MRCLIVCSLFVLGCEQPAERPFAAVKPAPPDPSLSLRGAELEKFCDAQHKAGAGCSGYARCEEIAAGCDGPRTGSDALIGCDPYVVCRAKR